MRELTIERLASELRICSPWSNLDQSWEEISDERRQRWIDFARAAVQIIGNVRIKS